MGFYNQLTDWQNFNYEEFFNQVTENDVKSVLEKDELDHRDFLVLLSPAAENFIEEMAQQAHRSTVRNFGKVIYIYTPLYLANYCDNKCLYCGFNVSNEFNRKKLDFAEVEREAEAVAQKGIKDILILTGGSRNKTPISYISKCVDIIKEYFSSISIESYAMETEEYRTLFENGINGLTIYQEVYDKNIYDQVHKKGPKANYMFRLNAPERGCKAGMRSVNIGPLLGLDDWRKEAFYSGLHARYLQNKYLETSISLSVPRLRPHLGSFQPKSIVDDKDLVQIILAYRLFLPRAGITLSTREGSGLRNNLLPLGVTKISAEATTVVGGYTSDEGIGQFSISDDRRVEQVKESLLEQGYQPVFKNWEQI